MTTTLTHVHEKLRLILVEMRLLVEQQAPRGIVSHRAPTVKVDFTAVESLLNDIKANTIGLALDTSVDGMEALATSLNALITTMEGNTDDLETLGTSLNALITTLDGVVDSILTESTAINANTDTVEGLLTSIKANTAAGGVLDLILAIMSTTMTGILTYLQGVQTDHLQGINGQRWVLEQEFNVTGDGLVKIEITVDAGQTVDLDFITLDDNTAGSESWDWFIEDSLGLLMTAMQMFTMPTAPARLVDPISNAKIVHLIHPWTLVIEHNTLNYSVDDKILFTCSGKCRADSLPTVTLTNMTVATDTTDEIIDTV